MTQPDSGPFNRFIKSIQEISKIVLFFILIIFVFAKWDFIETQFIYMISNINSLQVGNVKLGFNTSKNKFNLISGNWPAYIRVSNPKIKFIDGFFDDNFIEKEFIDIQAKDHLDLNGGYIGDSNELMYLGHNSDNLVLKPGDQLRIYTFNTGKSGADQNLKELIDKGKVKKIDRSVTAVCITEKNYKAKFKWENTKEKNYWDEKNKLQRLDAIKRKLRCQEKGKPRHKGLFKADEGEGDRIILIDSNNQILMDFDYFITPQSMP